MITNPGGSYGARETMKQTIFSTLLGLALLSACSSSDTTSTETPSGGSGSVAGSTSTGHAGAATSGTAGTAASTGGSSSATAGATSAGAESGGSNAVGGTQNGGGGASGSSGGSSTLGGATSGGAGGSSTGGSSAAGAGGASFPFRPSYIIGADISWTLEDEAAGNNYADDTGVKPLEEIMANNGFNYIRLRTFVCPSCPGGYNSKGFCDDKHTVTMAKRVKACGMGILLDFHMADTWVSLGTGDTPSALPSAWKGMTPTQMQAAAHDYTRGVIQEMAAAGVTPDMVQIGNETNAGMDDVSINDWKDLSALIAAAIQGVKDINPNISIWVQNGRPRPDSAGGSNFDGWVDKYLGNSGTKLDIDGVCGSTYGTTNSGADWIESFSYVLDTYKKPVLSCEYTVASPDNNAGQIINTKVMRGFANHQGWGSFIWEPTRYPAVNQNTLFTKTGSTFKTNAAMTAYPALAKSYGLPVPSNKCVGSQYVY